MRLLAGLLALGTACGFDGRGTTPDAAAVDASPDAQFCVPGFVSFCPSGPPTRSLDVTTNTVLPTDTSTECLDVMPTSGGAALCILYLQDFSIAAGVTLRAWGQRPLAIYAKGTITILGTLDVSSRRTLPTEPGAGSRTCDAPTLPMADTGGSGGGAGGSMADLGGSGGVGDTDQTGGAGNAAGGAPGLATTFAATLLGGCAGQAGGGGTGGAAGRGGGAVYLRGATINVAAGGSVRAVGAGGTGGGLEGGGGGGGSGGSIVLETTAGTFAGLLLATGGGGGQGGDIDDPGDFGDEDPEHPAIGRIAAMLLNPPGLHPALVPLAHQPDGYVPFEGVCAAAFSPQPGTVAPQEVAYDDPDLVSLFQPEYTWPHEPVLDVVGAYDGLWLFTGRTSGAFAW